MKLDETQWMWIAGTVAVVSGVVFLVSRPALAASGIMLTPSDCNTSAVPHGLCVDYVAKFANCEVLDSRIGQVDALIGRILAVRDRYATVSAQTGVPWWFIGAIHSLEADLRFSGHLHNGDPLTARTVHVPAGRPVAGSPPFTWEESAIDSLRYEGLDRWTDWSVAGALYRLEKYNGMGYRNRGVPSPYLWSFSNQYSRGKFTSDGTYDPNAVSGQCGGGTLWRRMQEREII